MPNEVNLSHGENQCCIKELSSDDCVRKEIGDELKSTDHQKEEISCDSPTGTQNHEIICNIKEADATVVDQILNSTHESGCDDLKDAGKDGTESPETSKCSEDTDFLAGLMKNETGKEVAIEKPLQALTNEHLKAIREELEDLKQVRQTGDRRLHEELVTKTQSLKSLEEKFVKVSAELEMNVADVNAKNKALEEALRSRQEMLQRVMAERDAIRKSKCTLTLRLQVAEDKLRDVEHKLNSRVLGVEMEKARLTETLEGVRTVTEIAEEISSRIQRTLCDAGATVPQYLPSNNSPTLLIQKLINYTNQLLLEFQKLSKQRDALKNELSRREVDELKSQRIREFLHHEVDRYANECRRLSRELEGRQNSLIRMDLQAMKTHLIEKDDSAKEDFSLQPPKLEGKATHSSGCPDHTDERRRIAQSMDKGTQSAYPEQTEDEMKVAFREKTEKLITSLSQRIEEIGKTRRSLEKAAGKLEAKVRSASSIPVRGKRSKEMLTGKYNVEISDATYSNENNCCCTDQAASYHNGTGLKLRSALEYVGATQTTYKPRFYN